MPKWTARISAGACALALVVPGGARADVIDIGPNGEVLRLNGPAVVTDEGVSPIRVAAPRTASTELSQDLRQAGQQAQLSPQLIEAVAWAESRFNQSARSPAGAIGVMQLMPGTAADLGVDAEDAGENMRGGAAYLRQMLNSFNGDIQLALAAYNAGPEAVRRHGGVPPYPETQNYVASVLNYLAQTSEEGE